ncbi:MAG: peptidase [Verrucomicrobia bacterium]|nr:peptidase [Verrucomicrobiota bacterium]
MLGAAQEQPWRIEASRTRLPDYEAITKGELDVLAAEYLRPDRPSQFIVVPEKLGVESAN